MAPVGRVDAAPRGLPGIQSGVDGHMRGWRSRLAREYGMGDGSHYAREREDTNATRALQVVDHRGSVLPCCQSSATQKHPEGGVYTIPRDVPQLLTRLPSLTIHAPPNREASKSELLELRSLLVDPLGRRALTRRGELELTALQFDLLHLLVTRPGHVFTFDDLFVQLTRQQTGRRDPGVVRYHVARPRSRLGPEAALLVENVRGCGYRILPSMPSSVPGPLLRA